MFDRLPHELGFTTMAHTPQPSPPRPVMALLVTLAARLYMWRALITTQLGMRAGFPCTSKEEDIPQHPNVWIDGAGKEQHVS